MPARQGPVRFRAVLLDGHKGAACEVPFDPAERWGVAAGPLWRGRRGHRVSAVVGGVRHDTAVVPRSKRFWMLVDDATMRAAGVAVGDEVDVALEPSAAAAPKPLRPPRRRR
jgi:uncharacterized protein DUF1905